MTGLIRNVTTSSCGETEETGAEFAGVVREEAKREDGPVFIALCGDLGVGKTVFVRGLVRELCPDEHVTSPTYALVNEYRGEYRVYHFDMYRISGEDDLESIGFYDYCSDKKAVILAEWSEKIPFALPERYFRVSISRTERENGRNVLIERISE